MLAILNSLNAHNLPFFQPILMILVSKSMVHRALSDKTYLLLGLLPPSKSISCLTTTCLNVIVQPASVPARALRRDTSLVPASLEYPRCVRLGRWPVLSVDMTGLQTVPCHIPEMGSAIFLLEEKIVSNSPRDRKACIGL